MHAFLNVVLPVSAIIFMGYLCGRLNFIPAQGSRTINGFVYYFALPLLFIDTLSAYNIADIFNGGIIVSFLGAQFLIMGGMLLISPYLFPTRLNPERILQATTSIFSNTGYMGIPLMLTAYGDKGLLPAIITTIINGAVILPLTLLLMEWAILLANKQNDHDNDRADIPTQRGVDLSKQILFSLIKNPLLIGAFIGIVFSFLQIRPTGAFSTFLNLSGSAAAPAALFAMGLFLVGQKINSDFLEIAFLTTFKVIVHPLLAIFIGLYLLNLNDVELAGAVIMAALPSGGLVFIMAQQFNLYEKQAAGAILLSTFMSLVTVSFFIDYFYTAFGG